MRLLEGYRIRHKFFRCLRVILSCAGLLHDLGNPPFGHVGEEIIREWFKNNLKMIFCKLRKKWVQLTPKGQ